MPRTAFQFPSTSTIVVGSIGDCETLASATYESLAESCDIAEIRLDLCHQSFSRNGPAVWHHLLPFPLLFTARSHSEGSPYEFDTGARNAMLAATLDDASLIDIEAIHTSEMSGLISEIISLDIPWIASFHEFDEMPSRRKLDAHAEIAREAGATGFKAATRLRTLDDLTALAHFQLSDPGIPLSTMGMGVLAPVSRLLCAQAGSVLNYGYVGTSETAPGQWSARQLREAIRSLNPLTGSV